MTDASGSGFLVALIASGLDGDRGVGILLPLAGFGSDGVAIGSPSLLALTGEGFDGIVKFLPWTAEGIIQVGAGAPVFSLWTAVGNAGPGNPLPAEANVFFPRFASTGQGSFPEDAVGSGTLSLLTALGGTGPDGITVLLPLTASGYSTAYTAGVVRFKPLAVVTSAGFVYLPKLTAYGISLAQVPATYSTQVMNTRNSFMTEYTNHNFDSYAKIGADYYGVGPGGLVRIGEGLTDDGSDIQWLIRTGQMDDGSSVLKRLPEIVLGLRSTGEILVRVWKDDSTFADYTFPSIKTDTIHQHRVKPGKGMRSRYFMVELQGVTNSVIELDSMQVNMTETSRRLG